MIQMFVTITCDKCIKQHHILVSKEDFRETVGGYPKKAAEFIHSSKWKDLPDDKHLCPKCIKGYSKLVDEIDKLKYEYWR